ncbi:MAG: chemotaxis protein [Clostridiales bacterium]|nr:chemotaxis protein [Clostridiales bacterium]
MSITNSNILLETGTNELEVLEFTIAGKSFGINVAKVLELMQAQEPHMIPHTHPCIEGIFQPRNEVYTILDLAKYLGLPASEEPHKDLYIITNFNQICLAFHVHTVENIHRISWEAIDKLDELVYGGMDGVVTGIAKIDGRIISILDFEKITYDVNPATGVQVTDIPNKETRTKFSSPILVAEDSALLRKLILETLNNAGYSNVIMATNGSEAWKILNDTKEHSVNIHDDISCIITDIEMPQMDGHRLTKLIKADPVLAKLPVVIFSSLINDEMRIKGSEVGADCQLTKPEIGRLLVEIDNLLQASA